MHSMVSDPITGVIRARSKNQAMDWSLVLTSQDIASTILQHPEDGHWMLVVDPRDHREALEAIRQYRLETRRWFWRRELVHTGILFDWRALIWVGLMLVVYAADARSLGAFRKLGLLDSEQVWQGQWWRLFTAMTLHGDAAHLAMNCAMIFVFGGLAMARFGFGGSLWAGYLAGLFGNLAACLLDPATHRSLGSSGIVMGNLGLVAVQSAFLLQHGFRAARYVLGGFMSGIMLFVLFGLDPRSDVLAHAGGFAGGAALGVVLNFLSSPWRDNRRIEWLAAGLWTVWVLLTWRLAAPQ
jgi:membrane associated rhomboid family serine protease